MNYLKLFSILYYIGMAIYIIGILTQLSGSYLGPYLLIIGVLPIIGVRIYNRTVAIEARKRINTILLFSSFFLAAAGITVLMNKSYWIIFIIIGAVLDGYSSFRRLT